MSVKNRVCICIAGWHFPKEFFLSLRAVTDVDIFIVSHKPKSQIPEYVFSLVPIDNVFVEPNYGYDWGCYQQFLDKGLWKKYSHVVFMHDDIEINRIDFIEAGIKLLEQHHVIGNSRIASPHDWFASHPESFGHTNWKPKEHPFLYDVVRGSFFLTTKKSLERLGDFDVFWDRLRTTPYFGNWSLRASCGKWQELCGQQCFGYLSDTPLVSEWIVEMVRGEDTKEVKDNRGWLDRVKSHIIYILSKYYMKINSYNQNIYRIIAFFLRKIIRYSSTCP